MREAHKSSVAVVLLAAVCSFLLLGAIVVLLLRWQIPHAQGMIATLAGCFVLSAIFGFMQPLAGWRTGLWTSAAFWLYFGGVSMALFFNSQFEWIPFLEAAAALVTGCIGAFVGGKWNRKAPRRLASQYIGNAKP
jgi:peptidoglycan/LPS O-acetylase OafA/YrhL